MFRHEIEIVEIISYTNRVESKLTNKKPIVGFILLPFKLSWGGGGGNGTCSYTKSFPVGKKKEKKKNKPKNLRLTE